MTVYTLTLPYKAPPLHLNQRLHWASALSRKKVLAHAVAVLAKDNKLPKGALKADITLVWHPEIKRQRDVDNPTPTLKAAVDALVLYGLVSDDNSDIVTSHCEIAELRKPGELLLRIEI